MSRFHAPCPLVIGTVCDLPEATVRHMQVHRLQPGDAVDVFNGEGGVYRVRIAQMSRQGIAVEVLAHEATECEPTRAVHLAVAMPANDRMDWLVEKATELGVHRISPLMSARSVLKLEGERALKKQAHWQAIAANACAQCGRNRVPRIEVPLRLDHWLGQHPRGEPWAVLSLQAQRHAADALASPEWANARQLTWLLGPEGGLTETEEQQALAAGAEALSLGPRVLRVETAAIAALVTSVTPH